MDIRYFIIGIIILFMLSLLSDLNAYTFIGLLIFLAIIFIIGIDRLKLLLSPGLVLGIIIVGIIFFIISAIGYGIYEIKENRNQIQQNWPQYRCKPYIIPFAGMIGPAGTTATSNFGYCINNIVEPYIESKTKPLEEIIEKQNEEIKKTVQEVEDVRVVIKNMKDSLRNEAVEIYDKIYNSYVRINSLYKTVVTQMKLTGAVFEDINDATNDLKGAFTSLTNTLQPAVGLISDVNNEVTNVLRPIVPTVNQMQQTLNGVVDIINKIRSIFHI